MSRRQIIAGLVILLLAAGGGAYLFWPAQQSRPTAGGPPFGRNAGRAGGPPALPTPVLAAPAKTADVPVYLDGVGTARALNTVTVRPQVDGKLISLQFTEGQDVKRGDVLATIDPTTYRAQLEQAEAKQAQDEAQLANARTDLERFNRLASTNAITKQQADTQAALVRQLEALVKSDEAAVASARAILGYTEIRAPISGRTGLRQVDEGNIVHQSDANGIVTITQIQPIAVLFNLPQQTLPRINQAMAAAENTLPVDSLASDSDAVVDHGKLTVVDNQVDQTTGTVKLKAEFPNERLQLWPGQFVNVRLLIDTLRQVVVIPTAAVQRGPDGTFVFLVRDNATVEQRKVTVSQQSDVRSVVTAGVEAGDKVVTSGFARLTDGARVSPTVTDDGTEPATAPIAPGARGPDGARQRRDAAVGRGDGPPRVPGAQAPAGANGAPADRPRRPSGPPP